MLAVSAGASALRSADFSAGFSVTVSFSDADRSISVRSDMPLAFTPASGRLLTTVGFSAGFSTVLAAVTAAVAGASGLATM